MTNVPGSESQHEAVMSSRRRMLTLQTSEGVSSSRANRRVPLSSKINSFISKGNGSLFQDDLPSEEPENNELRIKDKINQQTFNGTLRGPQFTMSDLKQKSRKNIKNSKSSRQLQEVVRAQPMNGCDCSDADGKGCIRTQIWLQKCYDNQYSFLANYKVYQGLLAMAKEQCEMEVLQDIDQDLERTFVEIEFFERAETR
jgi:hypothetical protein